MNDNRLACDPNRIDLFLHQQLSDEEQTAFELHLDECGDCRRRLESTAAGEDVWSGVRDSLRGESLASDGLRSDDFILDSAMGGDAGFSHATVLKLLAPTDDDRMLGRLGTYEVAGVIGSGGMGVVLKASDTALNRYVAIKVLAPHLGSSGAARKRFSREAQAAAAVVHDNVLEIHGVADVEGLPYLVMPYVRGPSLQRRLDDAGPLALVEILRIGMQAAAGLAAAHAQGLVHRDVKPANILLADGVERVKLTDFGLARAADDASLTKTGIIAGTPQYMSPEQARGESIDQRSDLFSLGSVLYSMCTGRAPFRAETSYGVLRRVTDEEPRPIREINPDIPDWLCRIIARLMSKRPDNRFASAREVADLLEQCLAHVQQPTAVPLPASLAVRPSRVRLFSSSRRPHRVIALIVALGLGLLGLVLWQAAAAPDIAGRWTGEGWGEVVLELKQADEYEGTYTDTFTHKLGTLRMKWSPLERRFNGTWGEGKERQGKISVRLVGEEVRGAWTTGKESNIQPGNPELADLLWKRSGAKVPVQAQPAAAHRQLAWQQSELYVVPSFNTFFPDDADGGLALSKLWNSQDKDFRPDQEVLDTVRRGLRRTNEYRTNVLRWIGNKYVWGKSPQNPDAIEIMYHAADFNGENADVGGTRHYAVYFGLSVVQPKTPAILRTLVGLCMRVDDPNDLDRVQWGAQNQRQELLEYLKPFLSSDDEAVRSKADICRKIFTGELKAFAWSAEQARLRAEKNFAHQLPQIKETLVSGTSEDRRQTLELILGERVSLIMDDSFVDAFAKCADDADSRVRDQAAVIAGDRWVWRAEQQNPTAIKLMLRLSEDAERQVRYNAVYYGLSTVRDKTDEVVRRLLELAFADRESNLFDRIKWGLSGDRERVAAKLYEYIQGPNQQQAQAARDIFRQLIGRDPSEAAGKSLRGRIDRVHAQRKLAWINLGEADLVNVGMRFEVRANLPEDAKDRAPVVKGTVEVVRILDQHESEVRIVNEVLNEKLIANDDVLGFGGSQTAHQVEPQKAPANSNTIRHFTTGASIRTLACSADGKLLAVANGSPAFIGFKAKSNIQGDWKAAAEILDAATGKPIVSLKVTTPEEDAVIAAAAQISHVEVTALALSPDGSVVAVGTSIGQIKMYSARSGELFMALDDRVAKLADKQTPEDWKSITRAMGSVLSLAFSPDGSRLVACGTSIGDYSRIFAKERQLDELSTGPGRLKVWDVKTGMLQHDLVGHSHANAVSFSPDGRVLASAGRWLSNSESGVGVVLWNAQTGAKLRIVSTEANGRAHAVAFSPDGKLLAIISLHYNVDNADDAITSAVSMVQVGSGALKWRQTISGSAKPVSFYGNSLLLLIDGQSFRFIQQDTGNTQTVLNRSPGPHEGGRWNDFAIVNEGHIWVIAGEDDERKGTIDIHDPDRPDAARANERRQQLLAQSTESGQIVARQVLRAECGAGRLP